MLPAVFKTVGPYGNHAVGGFDSHAPPPTGFFVRFHFCSNPKTNMKLKVYLASHFDPWFNLATENYIFNDMEPDNIVLFLWRNEKTIVIGRHQNPWTECDLEAMESDNVSLARRQTGGGAVYHDLGNTNFTFMNGRDSYNRSVNVTIIQQALARHGIDIEASGRNDLIIPGDVPRKISGSAYRETADRCFHHGTLLIDADLNRLATYLKPKKRKLESKGIKSVRSRVANLSEFAPDLNHDLLVPDIVTAFFEHYQAECEVESLDSGSLAKIPGIQKHYEELKDWDWRFGKTPEFSHWLEHRFEWGDVEVHLNSKRGVIRECVIYSDSLHPTLIEHLIASLTGINYTPESVAAAGSALIEQIPEHASAIAEFSDWLSANIR